MIELDQIKGIIVPLLTPVDDQENIDEQRLRKIVDHVIEGGVGGILAFGSNSEFYMFTDEELEFGFKIIIDEAAGRVPVFFGIGAIRTRHAVKLAQLAEKLNASGISVLQPMFIKPNFKELKHFFVSVADAVPDTAMLIYNNPRVGYGIPTSLISELAHEMKNVVGMKDSSGDMTYLSEVVGLVQDIEFRTFTGKDTLIYLGLCLGTHGSVCSTANALAPQTVAIYEKFMAGDVKGSRQAQLDFNPVRLVQNKASFPVATKDFVNILGLDMGNPVLPNLPTDGAVKAEMEQKLNAYLN